MNFNTLRYVVAVAKERSFTKAAKSLYVSQPTLSQNIQALETQLGTPLFDRKSYPIMPTYAGKMYIEFAQQVLFSESQINRKINNTISNPRMRIRIGISPSKSALIMPELIYSILEEFPDCIISLEDGKDEHGLFAMLENNEIDVMIGSPVHNNVRYKSQFIANELLLLAIPKAFDFPGKAEAQVQKSFRLSSCPSAPFWEKRCAFSAKKKPFLPAILSNVQTCRPLIISQNRGWVSL